MLRAGEAVRSGNVEELRKYSELVSRENASFGLLPLVLNNQLTSDTLILIFGAAMALILLLLAYNKYIGAPAKTLINNNITENKESLIESTVAIRAEDQAFAITGGVKWFALTQIITIIKASKYSRTCRQRL